ncbi:uncharacterized protein LOC129249409 [Anastrepha obliqua]|uniref:uncharacterized protein LOC129249409 n=1 Tax=Anastrepha obliqua TaxID=95512 RepID=UPI002409D99A|nr:uncharacterized protein LOC129249409 [Anastrepha obliqua]
MKCLLLLAFVAVAFAGSIQLPQYGISPIDNDSEIEVIYENEDGNVEIAPRFIVSWQARRAIRKLQKQMPCGFPSYGIPPLAPLKKREASVHLKYDMLETTDLFTRLRVDGLDDFKINKFKLNMIISKITFDFTFPSITVSAAAFETDTIIDALQKLGISVQYEGDGSLGFGLKNLRVAGTLRYKIPILWGSIKILSLKTTVSLDSCESDITGILGDGKLNDLINRKLESVVVSSINDNQASISETIESNVVTRVNKLLKGKDFWTILDLIINKDESEDDPITTTCEPPEDPWA